MQASSLPPVESLVPHRDDMLLIDEVTYLDLDVPEPEITVCARVRKEWRENWCAIELMAQAAAALAGAADRAEGHSSAPRPGFLLGTRRMELAALRFEPGEQLHVEAKLIYRDAEAASFKCHVTDSGGNVSATATINAFRPSQGLAPLC